MLLLCSLPFAFNALAAAPVSRDIPGGRASELVLAPHGRTGFTPQAPEVTGIHFTNLVAESRSLTNHILLNGSGVAAGDFDGDGWCDLYLSGLDGPNALYRNLGNWRFQDVAVQAGVACPTLDATGAVFADLDGDGDLDLLVSAIRAGVSCFLNDGRGRFQEVTAAAGLESRTASMTLTLADTDGDGDLDLYVANYRNETLRDAFRMQIRVNTVDGRRVITMVNGRALNTPELAGWVTLDRDGNITENGQADVLYRNAGAARFSPQSFASGAFLDPAGKPLTAPLFDWTLTAMFRDLSEDGIPDLYVCSDMTSPDRIWIGLGDGRFQAIRPTALRKTSWFSMGLDCGDLNRDGHDEIFVTDMVSRDHRLRQVQVSDHQMVVLPIGAVANRPQSPRNTLFLNCGDGDYLETAYFSGLYATEWSWSPVFLDVDLDGYEDVLIATGFERDVQDVDIANELEAMRRDQQLSDLDALRQRARFPRLDLPNLAFRNRGDLTFEEVGAAWGFDTRGVSQGTALADLDNDGDLDVIVNNMNGPLGVYRNDSPAPRLAVRLKGRAPNTRGIGARIRVFGGPVLEQSQEMQCGGRYLSCDDTLRVFAAGSATNTLRVEVTWRTGKRSVVDGLRANQLVEIDEASSTPTPPAKPTPPTLFEDVSRLLGHRHEDEDFPDFDRQPLLPWKLSQLGPGICWFDADGDGWEDLFIGSGKGGAMGAFRNAGSGRFQRLAQAPLLQVLGRDQTTLLGIQLAPEKPVLLAGTANYEDALSTGAAVQQCDLKAGTLADLIPASPSSPGPLAAADYDGDGDLDLFVGGRVLPGRYPEPPVSRLFRNDQGAFVENAAVTTALATAGMVSGAVWSDLDSDGFPELVLACEWGPVRVYQQRGGRDWREITTTLGLDQYRGWWNGLTAGDFDGDGRMDLAVSNWGQNNKYHTYRQPPLRLYSGDFADAGSVDLLEAYFFPPLTNYVPWQHLGRVGQAMPYVRGRFPTFRTFGQATVSEILGDHAATARPLEVNWLETTVFLNRGSKFDPRALPLEAQLTPAFALCVADADNDGAEDLFLSQNFFATEPETGRYDAGRGLWLRGNGQGGFRVWPASETGVRVYGEQRGAAVADYDRDGRMDLCVSQNGSATRLFRNTGARPGVRLRLRGPPGNPCGIGAQVQVGTPAPSRPLKEVHAGSGYWSQDSSVLILPPWTETAGITVLWPGGKRTTHQLRAGIAEAELAVEGAAASGPAE